ncbi:MAG TPA: DUF885 domain-containing protein [Steroidobacteraceae bacterium]|jgi:uncharacterized protein (DUF885 family)|nr:DUF885 domain-containing protein [Steroidobacteraceae bacterium]
MNKTQPLRIERFRIACLVAGVLCCPSLWAASSNAKPPPAGDQFEQLVDDFVFGTLALSPASATGVGYHIHHGTVLDDLLDDFSPAGIAASRSLLHDIEARIGKLETASLDAEQRADIDIMRDALGATRLELQEIQSYRHNPTTYVELLGNALYSPYVLHYAEAAERYRHIINRLNKVPELIRQAEANLQDSPEVWNRVAREENAGNVALIDTTLRTDCPAGERMRYDQAAAAAIAALNGFNHWLEDNLAEKVSDWRLGKERYAKKFRLVLATGKTPETLLAEAEADLAKTRAEIARLAAPKTVEQALADVARQHASIATYIPSAKQALAAATAFVKAKDLLTLPPNANLEVIETPTFMRGIYGVGGFNPAPALEPKLGAFFWVTPIPSTWPQSRVDSKLREYNDSGMQHLTVHEAMPGHYVQGEYANELQPPSRRLLRNIFGNGPYVEGWAVYSQQLMAEQGYLGDTPGYRLTLQKQLLRVLANTILDIRLQTFGMTDQEALDLMTQSTYQETEEATAKLQRAKLSSCQLPTYYAGYKGWLAVREHYQSKRGSTFNLKEFHESALKQGAVPLPVLDRLLQ